MKTKSDCYVHYRKLLKTKSQRPVTETSEYRILVEHHPHLAESLRLKTMMKRLASELKSAKDRQTRLQIKRELYESKARLKKENVLMKLHGESKHAALYSLNFVMDSFKEQVASVFAKGYRAIKRAHTNAYRKSRKLAHTRLPPSIFDLRSLDLAEKDLTMKEWVRSRRKQPRAGNFIRKKRRWTPRTKGVSASS